jgi:Holliday junction resolvase-like predicted endonuclease
MVNPKQKGKAGENEACLWFAKHVFDNTVVLERNHNQTFIGCDIVAHPFIVEVKRREALAYDKWWIQINKVYLRLQEFNQAYIPVVMFRQNRKEWEFLISATTIGSNVGWVHIPAVRFKDWAKRYV